MTLGLFEGFGIELEYMIVARDGLDVLPVCDRFLTALAAEAGLPDPDPDADVETGALAWSNELALHVVEMKTNGPAPALGGLGAAFQAGVARANRLLEPLGGRLMPTAMHPWMDPLRETRLWPHAHNAVYRAFDRIFDCRGHGWSNLQSMHINLPFANDAQFARLHAAIRLILPLIPALTAASPVVEGRLTGLLDSRMEAYRRNAQRIPSVTGRVIPDDADSQADYQRRILEPIYRDLAPLDPEGTLRHEWVNARGAIARFERSAIEIRVMDLQESPRADLAAAALTVAAARALAEGRWADPEIAMTNRDAAPGAARGSGRRAGPGVMLETAELERLLLDVIARGEAAVVTPPGLLRALGWRQPHHPPTAGALWTHLAEHLLAGAPAREHGPALDVIFSHGSLASRIRRALGPDPDRSALVRVYGRLCDCLADGESFVPA